MLRLLVSKQIREADTYTIRHETVSSFNLMGRAALKCTSSLTGNAFKIFCGPGNNGGDGLVIALLLLEDKIKADDSKVDTLVQMYTNMKPQQAAKVFETLDEDLVIEILSRMKKKSAADILNLVKADKAQVLSERYTGYRLPAHISSNDSEETETDKDKGGK